MGTSRASATQSVVLFMNNYFLLEPIPVLSPNRLRLYVADTLDGIPRTLITGALVAITYLLALMTKPIITDSGFIRHFSTTRTEPSEDTV